MTKPAPADKLGRPTLKTIAAHTGLAVTTVSRALNNGDDISLETRATVRRVADELGYVPNRAGVRLRTGRTQVVSLVLSPHSEVSGFELSMIMGMTRALVGTDYNLNVVPDFVGDDDFGPIRSIVETRSADGIVISRTQPQDVRVRWLLERGFPFVTHGRTELASAHASHDFDNDAFAFAAANRLIEKGRRRLMLIGPPAKLTFSRHMQNGFSRAVVRSGVETVDRPVISLDMLADDIRRSVASACLGPGAPDGIVCGGDTAGFAAIAGLTDAGKQLGVDADVVVKQTTSALNHLVPPIDSLFEDLEASGYCLANQLVRLIDGESTDTLQSLCEPQARFRTAVATPESAVLLPG